MERKALSPDEFHYDLPAEKIADKPAEHREEAKLLHYHKGEIIDRAFSEVPGLLPANSQLILNNTRVIHARLFLYKPSGGRVEVFLLRPNNGTVEEAMTHQGSSEWWCMVGGAKKWKEGLISTRNEVGEIHAEMLGREEEAFLLKLNWTPEAMSFAEVVDKLGQIPLPPYMDREPEEADAIRYQTTFAELPGSVAAPTAGLHFTEEILSEIPSEILKLTLHVSAGTFKPMEVDNIHDHHMHDEECIVPIEVLQRLSEDVPRFAVGTTSLRTLESLYWLAEKRAKGNKDASSVTQHDPYEGERVFEDFASAMKFLLQQLADQGEKGIGFNTSLMISPGYEIQSVQGIFTNFHMPKSTLLLLVSALIGEDWRKVYDHALSHDYRFLSYGDSSLLMP